MDRNNLAITTVVTRNYFHFAASWAHNVRQVMPEAAIYIGVVDRFPEGIDPHRDLPRGVQLMFADEMGIPEQQKFLFQYSPLEAACALKPVILQHALAQGHPRVIYLDSDMRVYTPLEEIFDSNEPVSTALTPHLPAPLPDDGKEPDELCMIRAGVYNGGLVGVANTPQAAACVAWWRKKCEFDGILDIASGLGADQKWLDLVPAMFDEVRIYRRTGYHTAYWNLPGHEVSRNTSGQVLVDGKPLSVFHFSGVDLKNPRVLSVYQNRLRVSEMPVVGELLDDYIQTVQQADEQGYSRLEYAFHRLRSGKVIQRHWREAVRRRAGALAKVENPFDDYFNPGLLGHLEAEGQRAAAKRKDWRLNGPPKSKARLWWKSVRRYWKPAA